MNKGKQDKDFSDCFSKPVRALTTKGYEKAAIVVLAALTIVLPSLVVYSGPLLLVNHVVTKLNPSVFRITLNNLFL